MTQGKKKMITTIWDLRIEECEKGKEERRMRRFGGRMTPWISLLAKFHTNSHRLKYGFSSISMRMGKAQ